MTYLCIPEPQGDGTPLQWCNCGCASITEVIDLSSCGRLRWESHLCRRATKDTSGGVEGALLAVVANNFTNNQYPITYRRVEHKKELLELLAERNMSIMLNTIKTVRTKYRTNGFIGLHWETFAANSAKMRNGELTRRYEDPGTTYAGWGRMPQDIMLEAAYAVRENGYWVMVGPRVCNVPGRVRVDRVVVREHPESDARRLLTLERGDHVTIMRSTTGGPWRRENGTVARGWWVIKRKNLVKGFVRGEALIQVGG